MAQQIATSKSIPPPVGGWNARDSLYEMPAEDAVRLENWFPDRERVRLRKGFAQHCSGLGTGVVESLAVFYGSDGTDKLLGFANGNIYDASTATASSLKSGLSSNRWETVMFRDRLVMVNGTDQPLQYDGSTISDATYTTISDDSVLTQLTSYRNRLYFIEGTSLWYGATDSITGALTEFDVHSLLRYGGKLRSLATWNAQSGDSFTEYMVLVSDQGEGIVYTGDSPDSDGWFLAMRFKLPTPIGNRCLMPHGSDLYYLSTQGVYPLSRSVGEGIKPANYERLTDKIRNAFGDVARSFASNWGWQLENYPQGHYLLVNIPRVTGATSSQFVMNTETGSWAEFTGQNAQSWAVYEEDLYFGGIDGKVYQADSGTTDGTNFICSNLATSFNYLGDRSGIKHFTMVKPVLEVDSSAAIGVDVDVDFGQTPMSISEEITGEGGTAWYSAWGSPWGAINRTVDDWYGVARVGRSASVKLRGEFKNLNLGLSSIDVSYISGGII